MVSGALTRVHFVSPAVVTQTVARYGVWILMRTERAMLDGYAVETRRRDWLALNATHSVATAVRDIELSRRGPTHVEARVRADRVRTATIRVRHREVGSSTIAVAL